MIIDVARFIWQVCVNAQSWNDYVSGVITTAGCGGYSYYDLDHCVQLTGYNLSAPEPYFAVRNSWATDWGVDGYVYLSAQGNTCGVANEVSQPPSRSRPLLLT